MLKQERAKHELRQTLTLADFMRNYAEGREDMQGKTRETWRQSASMFEHFLDVRGIHHSETTFHRLNTELLLDFRKFLTTEAKDRRVLRSRGLSPLDADAKGIRKLGATAAAGYLNTVLAALKRAHTGRKGGTENLLEKPIHVSIDPIQGEHAEPNPLDIAEVRRLMETPMEDAVLRRAALFSAMVGLRVSDIIDLKWGQVEVDSSGVWINKTIAKTRRSEYYPVPTDAVQYLSPDGSWVPQLPSEQTARGETNMPPDAQVFAGFKYSSDISHKLRVWVARAGIDRPGVKTFTFHDLRHTFAVTQIENGLDIYRLSKLMGHKTIDTTTRTYAKFLDKQKRQQVERINYSR
jgi:integrase